MRLRIIRNKPGARLLLVGGFAFFLIKGLAWLVIGALAATPLIW